ncbi:Axin1 [Anthophora quadrimaculata]
MSGSRQNEARCFNENSPRPPVPGEETGNYVSRFRPQSQTLTPRPSSLATPTASGCDASAPLGFEPEGCCSTTTMESDSPPACLRWARNLHSLLQDPVGLELFRKYLDQEGIANPLNFWFACEGLKEQTDPERIHQLVKLIYKKFVCNSQLAIPEDVRREANRRVKEGRADEKVFDAVQLAVERLINETTYPNFLQSTMYLDYVRSCQNPDSGGCPNSGSSREMSVSCGPSLLPTVHEDSEYVSSIHSSHSASETPGELRGKLRLTNSVLMATQQTRAMDLRPKPEAYAGVYLQHGTSPYHMLAPRLHAQYSSYNPVSRQDSELQSLSSDARTESDNMSLTDSSVDGASMTKQRSKKQYTRQCRAITDPASLNRDPLAHHTIIPRTQRVPRDLMHPLKPEEFAQVLIEKLEKVKRERESQEKLDRHLQDSDTINKDAPLEMSGGASKTLTDAPIEELLLLSPQTILDQHVSRVWSTPPGSSTFSIDSGNIHDFQEGSDFVGAGSMSSLGSHLPKSKSVPSDSLHKQDPYLQGHDQRFRMSDMTRRSVTNKSTTELTDSGVSVVSDAPPSTISKDSRLLSPRRLQETDKKADIKHSRHGKKNGSRSGSLEEAIRETRGVSAQTHTTTQLEEAIRRLSSCQQRHFTTVVFSFCDEQFPYRTKIPGHNVTLKQFKEYLPKKGSYRYFFKTECEDLDTKVVQEEITDDSEVLPLWEGKVMAQVKALE